MRKALLALGVFLALASVSRAAKSLTPFVGGANRAKRETEDEKKSGEDKETKAGKDIAGKQKIIKPPKDEKCEDLMEEESCAKFQPFCKLFKLRAYVACKKTCKLCPDDKPKGVKFIAELPELKGKAVLRQCAPRTTTYLTICVQAENKLVKSDKEYGLEIHDYAKIEKGGTKCSEIGPEFNPYNVLHGSPNSAMKKVGDLGNVKFVKEPPKSWPKEEEKCKEGQLGAYGLYNHVELFIPSSCPAYKPIVLHEKKSEAAAGSGKKEDGNLGAALFCGRLICEKELEKKKKGKGSGVEEVGGGAKAGEGSSMEKKTTMSKMSGEKKEEEEGVDKEKEEKGSGEKKTSMVMGMTKDAARAESIEEEEEEEEDWRRD